MGFSSLAPAQSKLPAALPLPFTIGRKRFDLSRLPRKLPRSSGFKTPAADEEDAHPPTKKAPGRESTDSPASGQSYKGL
jgi:hypothetical protein